MVDKNFIPLNNKHQSEKKIMIDIRVEWQSELKDMVLREESSGIKDDERGLLVMITWVTLLNPGTRRESSSIL